MIALNPAVALLATIVRAMIEIAEREGRA
jgi:hypothetical protein